MGIEYLPKEINIEKLKLEQALDIQKNGIKYLIEDSNEYYEKNNIDEFYQKMMTKKLKKYYKSIGLI